MTAKQRNFLHVDMDAYFAAVEQRDNPNLKGKAVIIGPNPHAGELRGVVSTCSYEARKFGIHSAMPIKEAFRRCPNAVYLHGSHKKYKAISKQIFEIMARYTPLIEPISLDEAFLDVSDSTALFGSPREIAQAIMADVLRETKLTCSVGIASKKYLAKIGSDFNKPNGITEIKAEMELDFLRRLPIEKLWGVGKKSQQILKQEGIYAVGDLQKYDEVQLSNRYGKFGRHMYRLANAIDDRQISAGHQRKSISKERTFHQDLLDLSQIRKTILNLCEDLAASARAKNFIGRTIQLKLRYADFTTVTRQIRYDEAFAEHQLMYERVIKLLEDHYNFQQKVRLLGVSLSNPPSENEQIELFHLSNSKKKRLSEAQDSLNKRFGKQTLRSAEGMGS